MAEKIESTDKSEESIQPEITLATLSIVAIDGIDKQISAKFRRINITSIEDLTKSDPEFIEEKTKMPLNKVIELQKKAKLVLQLSFNEKILEPLIAKEYTIEQAVEETKDNLIEISGQTLEDIESFLDNLRDVTILLDVATCRTTPISILPTGKPKPEHESDPVWLAQRANFLWYVELALIILFAVIFVSTITYALILA